MGMMLKLEPVAALAREVDGDVAMGEEGSEWMEGGGREKGAVGADEAGVGVDLGKGMIGGRRGGWGSRGRVPPTVVPTNQAVRTLMGSNGYQQPLNGGGRGSFRGRGRGRGGGYRGY
jgi:hypothetical protein